MEWIKFSDESPPIDEWLILGSTLHGTVTTGMYDGYTCINPDIEFLKIKGVTHWMPFPEPPEE